MTIPEIDVLYRNEYLLAISKPSGMLVHRGWGRDGLTVADVVRDVIVGAPVHAVHRLDRGTSGVLLFALNSDSARMMQDILQDETKIQKRYIGLVRGPMNDSCVLDYAIPNKPGGFRVDAVTEFRPVAQKDRWTLVDIRPRTGRLHQIRRHLKHLNFPVIGDVQYGKGPINRFFRETYGLHRLALHAYRLEVELPEGKIILDAAMPADLSEPLECLGMAPHQAIADSIAYHANQ